MAYLVNNVNTFSGADTAVSTLAALYRATINADQSRTLTRATGTAANYLAGQLYVTVIRDENWKSGRGGTTEEYKDNEGHVVLKRTFNYIPAQTSPVLPASLQMLSTYYVYDNLGNLAFVLPPGASPDAAGLPSAAALSNFCYQYQYDSRNRLVQKKLPGKDWEYMIYNSLDKVVATQDGNQRLNNQWIFTKYDALGRVMVTGTWVTAITRPALQLQVTQFTGPLWETRATGGYPSNVSWPTNPSGTLTVSYYDDYTFGDFASFPTAWDSRSVSSTQTKGLLTCAKTWVLGSTAVLYKVFYYDDLGRQTTAYAQHYLYGTTGAASLGNYDKIFTTYNFDNQASANYRYHFVAGAQALRVDNAYFYDHMGRKRQTYTAINNAASVLQSQLDYNEIGQLMIKHLHSENGGAFLQSATYSYNERGWLLGSTTNGNLFNMNLYYNKPTDLSIYRPSYNGNISEFVYSKTSAANVAFKYNYDQLNRLTNGTSTGGSTLGEQVSYDLMGNISALTRIGPNAASLVYTYYNSNGSNQLQTVTNGGAAFRSYGTYDPNGNAPGNGGITAPKQISYNLLNLPQTVTQSGATLATYTYDATGDKLANKGSDGYKEHSRFLKFRS
ncbi:hypothetical protein PQ469_29710 [Mucilaginibacter sp. KACC 22773]|uniref:hypothetical protein n=1 Tax=Mucilaginibacter sp. KACC 22773 TaxID=3025671 RepID=UPI002366F1FA|nr:hypothetical protein [Mucilaginibacter sp. KACC 22773]WDF78063.1 hypothetical protein PQ469_29710 [Mucilaginibacter sp. KACC 22773]